MHLAISMLLGTMQLKYRDVYFFSNCQALWKRPQGNIDLRKWTFQQLHTLGVWREKGTLLSEDTPDTW